MKSYLIGFCAPPAYAYALGTTNLLVFSVGHWLDTITKWFHHHFFLIIINYLIWFHNYNNSPNLNLLPCKFTVFSDTFNCLSVSISPSQLGIWICEWKIQIGCVNLRLPYDVAVWSLFLSRGLSPASCWCTSECDLSLTVHHSSLTSLRITW